MKKKCSWPEDPVVREVRQIRQRLWKEAGGTIEGLTRLLDREKPARRAGRKKNKTAQLGA
jgi:hypothetical protein